MAASGRHLEVVKYLLHHGALVNCQDRCQRTPLMEAAQAGDPRTVAVLCEAGAMLNAADQGGQTPLHAAVLGGHMIVAHELLARGANVNTQDQVNPALMCDASVRLAFFFLCDGVCAPGNPSGILQPQGMDVGLNSSRDRTTCWASNAAVLAGAGQGASCSSLETDVL